MILLVWGECGWCRLSVVDVLVYTLGLNDRRWPRLMSWHYARSIWSDEHVIGSMHDFDMHGRMLSISWIERNIFITRSHCCFQVDHHYVHIKYDLHQRPSRSLLALQWVLHDPPMVPIYFPQCPNIHSPDLHSSKFLRPSRRN